MIQPKRVKLTPADERDNYEVATLRDHDACVMRDLWFPCFGPTNRDHRQNRDPFNTIPSNLQVLCMLHHKWKTESPKTAISEGWGVPRNTLLTPAEWPARRAFRGERGIITFGFVLYDDEGRFREITAEQAASITDGMVA